MVGSLSLLFGAIIVMELINVHCDIDRNTTVIDLEFRSSELSFNWILSDMLYKTYPTSNAVFVSTGAGLFQ